jgi:hypothetical protein
MRASSVLHLKDRTIRVLFFNVYNFKFFINVSLKQLAGWGE